MDTTYPEPEVKVDAAVVQSLLGDQCPRYLRHDIQQLDEGWDNSIFRLGHRYSVRLPRREASVELLRNEQRWLPVIAEWIAVPVPRPVFSGRPSDSFPWPWSIVEWVEGAAAEGTPLDLRAATAMAEVLTSLHRPAPANAPSNPFRGVRLANRREVVEARLRRLAIDELDHIWGQALEAAEATDRVWLHGDLHPGNVVLRNGRLGGLIDWGDLCAGDRATDLACAWTLFEAPASHAFFEAYPHMPADRARAAGWAVNYGSGLFMSGEPRHVPMGEAIIRRLLR